MSPGSRRTRPPPFRLHEGGAELAFLKVAQRPLAPERDLLRWLRGRVPAPAVLGFAAGPDDDRLLTAPLPGADLHRPDHTADPRRLCGISCRRRG